MWPLVNQTETVYVAVIDTGVDYTHPDLRNRVSLKKGYDFVKNDPDPMDDNGHGTHVSGIIAAEMNNNEGIVGLAGSLDVSIIPIKVLDYEGQGKSDVIAKGIKYAVDQGANIINLSLGGSGENNNIVDAIRYANEKGVFVVAAPVVSGIASIIIAEKPDISISRLAIILNKSSAIRIWVTKCRKGMEDANRRKGTLRINILNS